MIKAAEAQRNVVIQLSLVADPKNKSVAGKIIKTFEEIETAAIKAAKAAADIRVKISEKELKKRKQFNNELLNSINHLGEESLKETQKTNKKVVSQLRKITKRMKKIWESLEDAKTDKTKKESDKREKCLENEAKASEKLKAAYKKQIESQQKATEAGLAALQGVMDLTEGLANLGLMSDENFKKFEQGFQKIEAGYKALKGFTELVWKGREALIAMRESQEALLKTQALLATFSGGRGASARAAVGFAAQFSAEAASGITTKRVTKEAAKRVATKTGGGLLETVGVVLANYLGARGFGGAGSTALQQAGKGVLGRVGGITIGGALRGVGRGIMGGGRAAFRLGGSLLGRVGGMTIGGAGGLLAAGSTLGTLLMETRGGVARLINGGSFIGSGEGMNGPQQMGFGAYLRGLNPLTATESPIHTATSTFGAFRDMFSSGARVEEMQKEFETNKERNEQVRERQLQESTFRISQNQVQSNVRQQRIQMGPGTDLEKSKWLEIEAVNEVSRAKAAAQDEYQKQLDAMYANQTYNEEVRLKYLEQTRDKQAELVETTRNRLSLLRAQNDEHKRAVETSQNELQIARDSLKTARDASRSDRDSKLASFSKLSSYEKRRADEISRKHTAGGILTKREVDFLDKHGLGRELVQRYKANSARPYEGTLERLGDFKSTDKTLTEAQAEESRIRSELQDAITKEKQSRDEVVGQTTLLSHRFEELSSVIQKVIRVQADLSGLNYKDGLGKAPQPVQQRPVPPAGKGAHNPGDHVEDLLTQTSVGVEQALSGVLVAVTRNNTRLEDTINNSELMQGYYA